MNPVRPAESAGAVFSDARAGGRALRVTWHHEAGVVVLSLWRANVCVGSFRLAEDDTDELVDLLQRVRRSAYDVAPPDASSA